MGPSYCVPNDNQIIDHKGNITVIPKEATQEKEKENLKLQPEKLKKKEKEEEEEK